MLPSKYNIGIYRKMVALKIRNLNEVVRIKITLFVLLALEYFHYVSE